jgi:RND family efflux transporter MFP subunit
VGRRSIKKELDALRIDRSAMDARRPRVWAWLAGATLLLILAGAASVWWLGPSRAEQVRTFTVREQVVSGGGGATVLNASGYVTARRRATVASKITGRLVEVHVEEGVPVQGGQVLARLDDSQHRASLALAESRLESAQRAIRQTEAQLELARLTLGRTRRLVGAGVVDREKLDEGETEVVTLEARLALEQQQVVVAEREVVLQGTRLDDTVIRAPFDGVVVSKDAQPGEMVSPNSAGGGFTRTGICTIVDMGSLEIEVDVNESYISRVHPAQRVEAILDAYPDWRIPGKVITTIPTADRQKATVLVRIGFDKLDPRILPDMGIKVAFRESGSAEPSAPERRLLVPRAALRDVGGKSTVYLVNNGRVERRAVTVGGTANDQVVVLAGLSAGEQVIVEGPENLSDGDRVSSR